MSTPKDTQSGIREENVFLVTAEFMASDLLRTHAFWLAAVVIFSVETTALVIKFNTSLSRAVGTSVGTLVALVLFLYLALVGTCAYWRAQDRRKV